MSGEAEQAIDRALQRYQTEAGAARHVLDSLNESGFTVIPFSELARIQREQSRLWAVLQAISAGYIKAEERIVPAPSEHTAPDRGHVAP